nr:acyl-protein synthetase [uncultured Lachnoclostridium sp.]
MYDLEGTEKLFVAAIRDNLAFHNQHCKRYAQILIKQGIAYADIQSIEDLHRIPPLPTLYYKKQKIASLPCKKMVIKATSSGTSGSKSQIGYDAKGLYFGAHMVYRIAKYHKLLSSKPTNYIILGYQPNKENQAVTAKTALGATYLAPAKERVYALQYVNGNYELNIKGMMKALVKFSKQSNPVRILGFPAYALFLANELEKRKKRIILPKGSKVILGGGWKQFYSERVEKDVLYQKLFLTLGIEEENIREFYGAVEHPMLYCDCKNHHFHVPIYSRVIVRDVDTLLPVANGKVGILNFLTPLMESMPLTSVMTDDLGVLHDGAECGCGNLAPYFEVIGRAGLRDIHTCTQGAEELLGGRKK